jgi:ribonuclease P protein component
LYNIFYEHYLPSQQKKKKKNAWFFSAKRNEGFEKKKKKKEMASDCCLNKKANLFLLSFKKGKKREGNFLKMFFLEKKDLKKTKIFPIVPKKEVKLAVKRNKIKRWIREALRKNLNEKFLKGVFIVFLKKNLQDLNFQKVEKEIKNILKNV